MCYLGGGSLGGAGYIERILHLAVVVAADVAVAVVDCRLTHKERTHSTTGCCCKLLVIFLRISSQRSPSFFSL